MLAASPGFPLTPAQEDPPSLAEAARRHRARIEASREQRGAAPRFTDADLTGGRLPGPDRATAPLETEALRDPPITGEDLPLRDPGEDLPPQDPGEDTTGAGDEEVRANLEARRREIAERENEIRERLLDIEASLAAVGASGLPYAPRNPTRFQSALDTTRLRAEQQELNQELEALAAERTILR